MKPEREIEFRAKSGLALSDPGFAVVAIGLETLAIVAFSVITGAGYHKLAYGYPGDIQDHAAVGLLAALFYVLPFALRDEYRLQGFLRGERGVWRLFRVWNFAILCLGMIAFLTKTTSEFSRGYLVLFYFAGFLAAVGVDRFMVRALRHALSRGLIARRKLMLVGTSDEIAARIGSIAEPYSGLQVVAQALVPADAVVSRQGVVDAGTAQALEEAVAKARELRVDDVIILADWSREKLVERIVESFAELPVAVHLNAADWVNRYPEARLSSLGSKPILSVAEPPLGPMQLLSKRVLDILLSATALVLLSPLFAVIAAFIRLEDGKGSVFFLQRRRGFNHEVFHIWKFRTMTTTEDGDNVVQAKRDDQRITRVGRYLRRFNLDELPQLVNVLKGEMSLVGPRPHAVAHDRFFERRIDAYPRRLNVKPGITGWAQVNGLRGATDTEQDMRQRVEHDLYYIDNWSILFDLYILALTVISPKAYRNAF